VAAAAAGYERERLLRIADREAARIIAQGTRLGLATGPLTRAAVAHLRGDQDGAVRWLEQAVAHAEASDMRLHAAVARKRLGRLLGGDAGVALQAAADAWMAEQELADRDRMAQLVAPGFDD
jgi:hypothetical protein